ncbi:MAG: hypothetical protein ABR511_13800 [Acidimicrobiales bacterium]
MAVAAAATAGALLRSPRAAPGLHLVLLVVAFAALGAMVVAEHRRRRLGRRLVLAASGALLVLAVVVPPTESADVWSYAMYGRMVATYHVSPYRHLPAEYRTDPIGRRVPAFWVTSRSVYGPAFTAVSAAGMAVAGTSPLAARLFFQGLAALAVAVALVVVDRRSRDPVAVALLGVNPVVVVGVVNGAHNDALVGLAVLGGALLVAARRPVWAGAALAAGALVKVAALLPLGGLVAWVWWHHGRRPAAVLAATAGAVGLAGLGLGGGTSVVSALGDASARVNGGSVWAAPLRWLAGTGTATAATDGRALAWVGTALAVGLLAVLARRRPEAEGPVLVAGAAVVAYLLVGTYVLPWYLAWGLPVLALAWRWRVGWLALLQAAVLELGTARPATSALPEPLVRHGALSHLQTDIYQVAAPLLEVALVAVVVAAMVRRLRAAPAATAAGDEGHPRRSSATSKARSRD